MLQSVTNRRRLDSWFVTLAVVSVGPRRFPKKSMADGTAECAYCTGDDTSRCCEWTGNENVTSAVRRRRIETVKQDFVTGQFVNNSPMASGLIWELLCSLEVTS